MASAVKYSNGNLNYTTTGMKVTSVKLYAVFVETIVSGRVVPVVMYITTLIVFGMQKRARADVPIVGSIDAHAIGIDESVGIQWVNGILDTPPHSSF